MKKITALFFLILFSLALVQAHATKMYKWRDAEGKLYFSDKVPPKDAQFEKNILNEKGQTIAIKDAEKTPEQLSQLKKIHQLQKTKKKLLKEQQQRDLILLKVYQTEEDIDKLVHNKQTMLKSHTDITNLQTKKIQDQRLSKQQKAADFERSGKPVPEKLLDAINVLNDQFSANQKQLESLALQKMTLTERAEQEKKRFKEIKGKKLRGIKVFNKGRPSLLLGELSCNKENCADLWEKSFIYLKEKSDSKIIFNSNNLVLTRPPKFDKDISPSLTKLAEESKRNIILDIRCKDTIGGRDACQSERVSSLIKGFNALAQP